jgi:hypothetical protein
MNIPADALSRPSNADQGKDDNRDVALIPPERFINVARTDVEYRIVLNRAFLKLENTKCNLMVLYHDHPTAGHPGRDETIQKVQQSHNWIGMKQWIADYVKGCAVCQQNKIQMHKRKTPLYKITTTEGALPFQQVAMDLITELPAHKGYNAILTIVDHGCSRTAIFLPCLTTITGPRIARLYLDNIYRWFGLPTKIISDRDPRFTSHFGKALTERLGIQQNLSSAFHPQTDGVTLPRAFMARLEQGVWRI